VRRKIFPTVIAHFIDVEMNFENVRFPFDQKFWFEISGIPYDEWNGIFRLLNQSIPSQHAPSFERKYKQ